MNLIFNQLHQFNVYSAWPTKPLQHVALLFIRSYIAWVFFASALVKLKSWENTVFLFQYEYQVPYLSYELAAFLGTGAEVVFPILLVLGLATRFSAVALFVVNWVALISFEDMPAAAETLHYLWGLMMIVVALWGAGFLSLDKFLERGQLRSRG